MFGHKPSAQAVAAAVTTIATWISSISAQTRFTLASDFVSKATYF